MLVEGGTIYGLENIEKRKERYSLVDHDIVVDADVCIIGSGAAGAIMGEKLANESSNERYAGKSVVILAITLALPKIRKLLEGGQAS